MKFKIALILGMIALLWAGTSLHTWATVEPASKGSEIKWYGYDEGMALGKKEGKKILLHFYADWCGYCKKMDRDIFSKAEVAAFMNENFIPIKLNSDKEIQLAKDYQVTGLPTTWFLDKNGTKLQNLPGYLPEEQFLGILKYFQTDSYKNISFKAFMGVK